MSFSLIKENANKLFSQASFISHIKNDTEYKEALELMDELIEEYDNQKPLIEILAHSIEAWETESKEFKDLNNRLQELDGGVAVLRVLMDQYQLKADDLKSEIGSKSLVSMILNGSRKLTKEHIQALCDRFHISPALFFDH